MTTATTSFPVDELRERAEADRFRPGRAAATAVGWFFAALGWLAGRFLVIAGWAAGRTWMMLAYMAEAVIFGFRNGAGLPLPPPKAAPEREPRT
jgi:hypothetical protein